MTENSLDQKINMRQDLFAGKSRLLEKRTVTRIDEIKRELTDTFRLEDTEEINPTELPNLVGTVVPLALTDLSTFQSINEAILPENQGGDTPHYKIVLKQYGEVCISIFESLKIQTPQARYEFVRKEINNAFPGEENYIYNTSEENHPADPRLYAQDENPQSWLVHSVLNAILYEETTPEGNNLQLTPREKIRAMDLLNLYPLDELAAGFRSDKNPEDGGVWNPTRGPFETGYDKSQSRPYPIPDIFWQEGVDYGPTISWRIAFPKVEKYMTNIIDAESNADNPIDYERISSTIIENNPESAVEIALLFLHEYDGYIECPPEQETKYSSSSGFIDFEYHKIGLAILQNIPKSNPAELRKIMSGMDNLTGLDSAENL